ncbi:MAG: hypothetical protein O3A51_14660 [Verrucomicrobia bacterium]|nr:hypothetical protein [Verrucomicrobiota bacterium]
MTRPRQFHPPHFGTIIALALLIRLIVVIVHLSGSDWSSHDPNSEMAWIARNLATGHGFSSPFGPGDSPTAWLAPIGPAIWAACFHALGDVSPASLWAILLINVVASTIAAACLYGVFLIACGTPTRSSPRSWIAFLPILFWPPTLHTVSAAWYYSLQDAALAGLTLITLRWDLSGRRPLASVGVGLTAGLVAYVNPVPLLPLGIYLLLTVKPRGEKLRPLPAAIVLTVMALTLAPWTARNAYQLDRLVPMRSSFGVELLQGNNPDGSVRQNASSLHPALDAVENERYVTMGEGAYTQVAMAEALDYMQAHPYLTLKRTLLRAYVFWCSDITGRWPWNGSSETPHPTAAQQLWVIAKTVLHNLPWMAGLAVCLLGWMRLPQQTTFLWLIILLLPLPYYVTHVSPEYAYPVQPYLLLLVLSAIVRRFTSSGASPADSMPS